MANDRARGMWLLGLIGLFSLAVAVGLVALRPEGTPLGLTARIAALMGYQAVFWAIVSSAYVKQVYRLFGRSFVKIHHALSIGGLVWLTLHPLAAALDFASAQILLPQFDSLAVFFRWGGPPALYLLAAAALTAALRRTFDWRWRQIHLLNYIAFWLGTIHAVLLGTDLQSLGLRAVAIAMGGVVTFAFARRHLVKPN